MISYYKIVLLPELYYNNAKDYNYRLLSNNKIRLDFINTSPIFKLVIIEKQVFRYHKDWVYTSILLSISSVCRQSNGFIIQFV